MYRQPIAPSIGAPTTVLGTLTTPSSILPQYVKVNTYVAWVDSPVCKRSIKNTPYTANRNIYTIVVRSN